MKKLKMKVGDVAIVIDDVDYEDGASHNFQAGDFVEITYVEDGLYYSAKNPGDFSWFYESELEQIKL